MKLTFTVIKIAPITISFGFMGTTTYNTPKSYITHALSVRAKYELQQREGSIMKFIFPKSPLPEKSFASPSNPLVIYIIPRQCGCQIHAFLRALIVSFSISITRWQNWKYGFVIRIVLRYSSLGIRTKNRINKGSMCMLCSRQLAAGIKTKDRIKVILRINYSTELAIFRCRMSVCSFGSAVGALIKIKENWNCHEYARWWQWLYLSIQLLAWLRLAWIVSR